MKVLLVALNAKYIHSNPAIYSLRSFANKYEEHIFISEFTINNQIDEILQEIYKQRPQVLAFSCYIWNISMVTEIIREYKKVDSQVKIWVGGPEVSFDTLEFMESNQAVDGVMIGEGEQTFLELIASYVKNERKERIEHKDRMDGTEKDEEKENGMTLSEICGIAYRELDKRVIFTKPRAPLDFQRLPFLYPDLEHSIREEFSHRILYYESSRGCPFSCSYCLSSVEKGIRFRDIDLVKEELSLFLSLFVAQVKFIDRTFNCKKSHCMEIWRFIKEQDNGVTNFHFEITAELLDEEELALLRTLRPGLIQLEIGVQSVNERTVLAVHRTMQLEKLTHNVAEILKGENIHVHLDLIAGLPYEDYPSFRHSFDTVYRMRGNQLQLGFLKVLKGSSIRLKAKEFGIVSKDMPPYEVLYTTWLTYDQIIVLKGIEDMVEVYYNSGQFINTLHYLEQFFQSPFSMYESLFAYYEEQGLFHLKHTRLMRYEHLRQYVMKQGIMSDQQRSIFDELMLFDLYSREKLKSRPPFAAKREDKKQQIKALLRKISQSEDLNQLYHVEFFHYDVTSEEFWSKQENKDVFLVFDYGNRNPLTQSAKVRMIEADSLDTNQRHS